MFERWIRREHDRRQLESSILQQQLVSFAIKLESDGYAPTTLRRYHFAAAAFGRWFGRRKKNCRDVDEAKFVSYLSRFHRERLVGRTRGRLPNPASGVRRLAEMLLGQGTMSRRVPAGSGPADEWVAAFDLHLLRVAGLSLGTRRIYCRYARALIVACFKGKAPDWAELNADKICEFARLYASYLKPSACRAPVTATRAFVRFLVGKGLVASGLVGAVPTVRQWKQSSLPNYISADQVAAVLATCSEASTLGRRDRAILLMLVGLGLRASEVASLRLDDIRWREGIICVRGAKSGRERPLPFPAEVGAAVSQYLREGRPRSHQREVFLAFRAPHQSLSSCAISNVAARALPRADVCTARRGAHVFRHTAATRMVRAGAPFKDIADVLGHARLETTSIYAKLDVQKLVAVALPWPEVAP
jgi:site-specific recombinase XerD